MAGHRLASVESRASELLQLYGLNEREALVYLLVLRSGSASAGDIAKLLSLRRMEAYRLVKKLSDANMIQAHAGKPVAYSAQPMDEVVSAMMEAHAQKTKAMEAAKEELIVLSRSLPRGRPRPSEQQFRIIQGREQIYNKMARMADEAKESLALLLTKNDLIQAFQIGIVDKLAHAAGKGVKVRVLSTVDEATLESAEALQKKSEVRHSADAVTGRMVLQDHTAVLSSLVLDDSQGRRNERDIAVLSESPNYAEMMASLFDVAYRSAAEGKERIDSVKASETLADRVRSLAEVLGVTLS
jgi:sugar-specific transcriptional regulator TrmB